MLKRLLNGVAALAGPREIADVRMGLGFTAVVLDDGRCGLASTPQPLAYGGCTLFAEAGDLIGRPAVDFLDPEQAADDIRRGLAVAVTNAILNRGLPQDPGLEGALQLDNKRVAMVGHIAPLVPILEARAEKLVIIDRRDIAGTSGEEELGRVLPDCDLCIFTSQALVNGTLGGLVSMASGEIAMVGPSTPMWDGFGELGVTHLFGREVTDTQRVLRVVSQGGGTRRFGKSTRKVYKSQKQAV